MANDPALLAKMAKKLRRKPQGVREGISHRASRWRVTSDAAQVIWAAGLGISTGRAFSRLTPHAQQQVQAHGSRPAVVGRAVASGRAATKPARTRGNGDGLREAVNRLLADSELAEECADILKGRRGFRRAVTHATQVLESRLRVIAGPAAPRNAKAHDVASIVLHASRGPALRLDPDNAVQDGYYSLCAGVFAAIRNPAHHGSKQMPREQAISVCGFISVLLEALARGTKAAPASPPAPPSTASRVP